MWLKTSVQSMQFCISRCSNWFQQTGTAHLMNFGENSVDTPILWRRKFLFIRLQYSFKNKFHGANERLALPRGSKVNQFVRQKRQDAVWIALSPASLDKNEQCCCHSCEKKFRTFIIHQRQCIDFSEERERAGPIENNYDNGFTISAPLDAFKCSTICTFHRC